MFRKIILKKRQSVRLICHANLIAWPWNLRLSKKKQNRFMINMLKLSE